MARETLTSTGTGTEFRMGGDSNVTAIYTVAGISGTVVVQLEGTQDGTNWVNVDENGSTSITANGTYEIGAIERTYTAVRFNWVSGTATSIVVSLQKGNN